MKGVDRLRHTANWINLTTPLGLAVAALGRARLRPGPRGMILGERYRLRFPLAGAFTLGDVVLTASTFAALERRTPGVLGHERRHTEQYAFAGVWFLPGYALASLWSLARTGNPALANPWERQAGLVTGGYVHAPTGTPTGPIWRLRGEPGLTGVLRWSRRTAGDAPSDPADGAGGADADA